MSETMGYVLLIIIGISLSIGVYSYLKIQVYKERPECEPNTALFIENPTCTLIGTSSKQVTLTLYNSGLHKVDGAYVRLSPLGKKAKTWINDPNKIAKGYFYLSNPQTNKEGLQPGEKLSFIIPPADIVGSSSGSGSGASNIYELEVQPAAFTSKGGLSACVPFRIQRIGCYTIGEIGSSSSELTFGANTQSGAAVGSRTSRLPGQPYTAITAPITGESFTSPATITISAYADDEDGTVTKVEFFEGANKLGEDTTSPYSFTWNSVPAGSYFLTSKVTDNSDVVMTSTPVAITVNAPANQPPTTTLTSPASGSTFTSGADFSLTASATDSDGTVTKVEFFEGANKLGEDTTSPYSFTWNSVPAGSYSLTSKATDNTGATTFSTARSITVNPPSPTTLQLTVTGTNIGSSAANQISAAYTSGAAITSCTIGGTPACPQTATVTQSTSVTFTALPFSSDWIPSFPTGCENVAGTNTCRILDIGTTDRTVTLSFNYNPPINPSPQITNFLPANAASVTAGNAVSFSAAATDDGTITTFGFYSRVSNGQGGFTDTSLGTVSQSGNTYTLSWTPVAGTYTIVAKATDNLGSLTEDVHTLTVNAAVNGAPTISWNLPTNGQIFQAPAIVSLSATATDDGSITSVTFWKRVNDVDESIGGTVSQTTSTYSTSWNSITAGTYTIVAKATDNTGLVSESILTIYVKSPFQLIVTNTPLTNENIANTITASATGITNLVCHVDSAAPCQQFFFQSSSVSLVAAYVNTNWASDLSTICTSLSGIYTTGTNTCAFTFNGPLTGANAKTIAFTYTPSNQGPTISNFVPVNGATPTAGVPLIISADVVDPENEGIANVIFYESHFNAQGQTVTNPLSTDTVAPYSFSWTPTAGTYTITATATDTHSPSGTTSLDHSITVNAPPTISITSPLSSASFISPATISIITNPTDDGSIKKVEFYQGSTKLGEDLSSAGGWTFSWASVPAGSYSITAIAFDNLDVTTTSAPISITVNTPGNNIPLVTLTTPASGTPFLEGDLMDMEATATDSDGTVTKVEFYQGSTKLGEDLSSPYTFTWNNLPAGTYLITARATDNQEAITISTASTVNIKSTLEILITNTPIINQNPGNTITISSPGITPKVCAYNSAVPCQQFFFQGSTVTLDATSMNDTYLSSLSTFCPSLPNYNYDYSTDVCAFTFNGPLTGANKKTINFAYVPPPNSPPQINSFTPTNLYTYFLNTGDTPVSVPFTATASDPNNIGGSIQSVNFYLRISGQSDSLLATGSLVSGIWQGSYLFSAAGTETIVAKATDNAGGVSEEEHVIYIISSSDLYLSVTGTNTGGSAANQISAAYTGGAAITSCTIGGSPACPQTGSVTKSESVTITATPLNTNWVPNMNAITCTTSIGGSCSFTCTPIGNTCASSIGTISKTLSVPFTYIPPNSPPTSTLTYPPSTGATVTLGNAVTLTATAGDTDGTVSNVAFYHGGTNLIGADTTSPYSVSWTPPAGTYTIVAKATDDDLSTTESLAYTLTVNAPPVVTLQTPPSSGSVILAGTSITLNAVATDPNGISSVAFYHGGTNLIGAGTYDGVDYVRTWTPPAGTYTITAVATDNNGATSTSTERTVKANVRPTVSISTPLHESTYTAGDSVTVTAVPADSDGSVSSVQFFRGGTSLGTDSNGADGWSASWSNMQIGSYSLTAMATDNNGETQTSSPITVSVNAVVPTTLQLTLSASNADSSTTANAVSASSGGTTITSCTIGTNCPQTGSVTKSASVTITATPLTNWIPSYPAGCTNVAGTNTCTISNIGTENVPKSVSFTYVAPANVPPAITLNDPLEGETYLVGQSVPLGACASDTVDDPDGTISSVKFYRDSEPTAIATGTRSSGTDSNGCWSTTYSGLAYGTHTIVAKATDNIGAITTASSSPSLTIKRVPSISLSTDRSPANYVTGETTTYTATISDPDSVGINSGPKLYWEDVEIASSMTLSGTLVWTKTIGPHSVAAPYNDINSRYTDSSSILRRSASAGSGITVTVTANAGPTVTLNTPPSAGSSIGTGTAITLSADVSDPQGVDAVTFSETHTVSGSPVTNVIGTGSDIGHPGTYTLSWTPAVGTYTITAKGTDNLGISTTSSGNSLTVSAPTTTVTLTCSNPVSDTTTNTASLTDGTNAISCSTATGGTASSSRDYPQGTSLTITASPATNYQPTWPSLGGTASGNTYTFTAPTSATTAAGVSFNIIQRTLTVSISNSDNSNTFSGVVSAPPIIACYIGGPAGSVCSDVYDQGEVVSVSIDQANIEPGWTASLSCSCASCVPGEGFANYCHVTMNAARTLPATFTKAGGSGS